MHNDVRNYKILMIYAHPADICCEGAGTAALQAERGDQVSALLLSDGERHHSDLLHREYAKPPTERNPRLINAKVDDIRSFKRAEAQRICDLLGIKELIALGWPDVHWTISQDRIDPIAQVIRNVRPDVVCTHRPIQNQIPTCDIHAVAGQLVRLACRHCSDSMLQIDGHEAHHTKTIYYFPDVGMADTTSMFGSGIVCDVWVDITPVIQKKIHAMDQLVSQGYHGTAARKIVEARDDRWGMLAGCSYAEPWMRDRAPRYPCLPVTSEELDKGFTANDLPGDLMICRDVPSATEPDAYDFPKPVVQSS